MDCALPRTRPGPRCAETTLSMRAKDTGQMAKGRLGACMGNLLCEDCRSAVHEQTCSIVVNPGRALGPHGPNQVQPTFDLLFLCVRRINPRIVERAGIGPGY